jgi:hypothetical protein
LAGIQPKLQLRAYRKKGLRAGKTLG